MHPELLSAIVFNAIIVGYVSCSCLLQARQGPIIIKIACSATTACCHRGRVSLFIVMCYVIISDVNSSAHRFPNAIRFVNRLELDHAMELIIEYEVDTSNINWARI